jgi:hypothetical protein
MHQKLLHKYWTTSTTCCWWWIMSPSSNPKGRVFLSDSATPVVMILKIDVFFWEMMTSAWEYWFCWFQVSKKKFSHNPYFLNLVFQVHCSDNYPMLAHQISANNQRHRPAKMTPEARPNWC